MSFSNRNYADSLSLRHRPVTVTSLCFAICVLILLAAAVTTAHAQSTKSWIRTERITDELGQPSYSMGDAVSALGRFLAVGSVSSNRGKGQVTIYHDDGNGLRSVAVLRDPQGSIGDQFGVACRLYVSNGLTQIAVSATHKAKQDGRVLIFQQTSGSPTKWSLLQEITPPSGTFVSFFGRRVLYDGYKLLISAERRYQSGPRFVLSFVNVVGTNNFIQSNGVDATIPSDPLLAYNSVPDRNSTAYFAFDASIADADFTQNVGQSFAVSGDWMAVGASFREELKYGSGSDGDLVVEGINLLDGAASYNFNSVTVKRGGQLRVDGYDKIRQIGGVLSIKVKTVFLVEEGGEVNVTGLGYVGGPTSFVSGQSAQAGQFTGGGQQARDTNVGCAFTDSLTVGLSISDVGGVQAGSVSTSLPFATANGGGGGYGTAGDPGTAVYCGVSGAGGVTYGDTTLSVPYRGSGGGSGMAWSVGNGGAGGNGGGVILISAKKFINYGHIVADGDPGSDGGFYSGGGGGGSGGSIRLVGDTLVNRGYIYARGGAGGARATGSGSGGSLEVKGGRGGHGRIYFDFLLTQSSGIVVPRPNNVTTYLGEVLLYRRDPATKSWSLHAKIPRHPSMMFIGHQVALSGHTLAIASDQLTPVSPTQKIFLIDVATVTSGMTEPTYTFGVIDRPSATDLGFGHRMSMMNQTLVVSASGSSDIRGTVYIFQSANLLADHSTYTTLVSGNSTRGDQFGQVFELDFPHLYVTLPASQDFSLPANSRRSTGNVQVFKFVRNVSAADSFVTCEFTTVTSNCTLNCTMHLFAQGGGVAAGDLNDIPLISPQVDFRGVGIYSFQVTLMEPGTHVLNTTHNGALLAGPNITVTNPINVLTSNVTCTPMVTVAGETIHCTIHTSNHSGEEIAAREFDVSVFVTGDLEVPVDGFNSITSAGVYRSPQSPTVFANPEETDYPVTYPKVSFVRRGVYAFSVPTSKVGMYAVYTMYKREALEFPNPVLVEATAPTMSHVTSTIVCPAFAAPNRTLACILYANGPDGTPTGDASFAASLSSNTTVNATLVDASNSYAVPAVGVFSGEGRYSILMIPASFGSLSVSVQIQPGDFLQPAVVTIAANFNESCNVASRVLNSFMLATQAMQGSTDTSVYGVSATGAAYDAVTGVCDRPKI